MKKNLVISFCPLCAVQDQKLIVANGTLEFCCGNPDHWEPNRRVAHLFDLGEELLEFAKISANLEVEK